MFATIFNYRISMQLYQKKIFIMIFVIFYDKVYLEKIILIFVIKYKMLLNRRYKSVFFFFYNTENSTFFITESISFLLFTCLK